MKAYIGIKYHKGYINKPVVDKISSALEKKGYKTMCIIRDIEKEGQLRYTSHELMKITFKEIDDSDVVIIELTEKGVGLGIEAGYAFAKNVPIITIAKSGSDVSETLVGISKTVIFYDNIGEIENIIENTFS